VNKESVKISLFCCLTNFNPDDLGTIQNNDGDELKVIPLPCSGKIDILYLTRTFEAGADGVAVLMCKQGECQYLEGNLRARKRVETVDALLEEVGLGKGRAIVIQLDDSGINKVIRELNDFRSKIKLLARPASKDCVSGLKT
jgi:F420-non-reducing hydrogenase iron-sulfur subunit